MFIKRVIRALSDADVPYVLAGGYALALHGAVRGTVDIDIAIALDEDVFVRCETALKGIGLVPRLPVTAAEVFHFREEYIRRRNLVAWSFHNPANPLEVVDILITEDAARLESVEMKAFDMTLRVASIPALMAMKRKAGRPQDLEDIRALERLL